MRYDTLCCTFASYNADTYTEYGNSTCTFSSLTYLHRVSNRATRHHEATVPLQRHERPELLGSSPVPRSLDPDVQFELDVVTLIPRYTYESPSAFFALDATILSL